MDNLEPITREEMLLDGQDLEPITRKEMFIKRIYDKTQVVPKPITREEMFLNKAGEGGGGDITVEQLNVTENGTYSESGKAYSPVVVNVPAPPIPENAYLLNDLSDLPADIASFTDGTDLPMASLKVAVTPYQDLHGYDGPWAGGAGKNKYEGSPLFDEYVDKNKWTLQAEKYNGHDVYKKSTAWGGMYKLTYLDVGTYTFSCMCKTSDSATTFIFLKIDNVTTAITDVTQIINATSTSWTKISGTFNVTSAGTVALRVERSKDNGDIYISEYQLESGSTPTSYAPYSNICPIIGWDEAVVTVADDVETPTVSNVYTIDLDGTRYGGTLDVVSGVLTVDRAYVDLGTITWLFVNQRFYAKFNDIKVYSSIDTANLLCDRYKPSKYTSQTDLTISSWNGYVYIRDDSFNGDTTAFKTAMNGVQLVYELATPITVQLSPTQVKSLEGVNNINANCGQITEVKYFKKA